MLHKLDNTVDAMPFSGKYAIQPAMYNLIRTKEGSHRKRLAGVEALLGGFVLAHGFQAYLGSEITRQYLHNIDRYHSPLDITLLGVSSAYTVANAAVTTRQLRLMPRAWQISRRRHKQSAIELTTAADEQTEKPAAKSEYWTRKRIAAMATAFSVTVGGQVAFATSLLRADGNSTTYECIDSAENTLEYNLPDEQGQGLSPHGIRQLRHILGDYCDVDPSLIHLPTADGAAS